MKKTIVRQDDRDDKPAADGWATPVSTLKVPEKGKKSEKKEDEK
jgi:hypothetical protein